MGAYIIAVGGTGNKILESVVYAACADAFYTVDARGERVPAPKLNLLSVDVDAACGNTTRAKRASEYYEDVRRVLRSSGEAHGLFNTELRVERWSMNLSRRATSIGRMAQSHSRDRLLARALFTRTEAELEYSEGFRGHPDLGVLFFSDLLESLDDSERRGEPDELLDFMRLMEADMARGETVKVALCGSIFGGTGASGIPALARYLRARYSDKSPLFELSATLMLPYYKVPPSSRSEQLEIVVKSSQFMDKARTALEYYGMAGMLKQSEDDAAGVFDALYLLGLPPEGFVTARNYSTGSQSQENDAHMLEWLATRLIASFLRTGFRGAGAANIDCYYYQWHTQDFRWQSFDTDAELFRAGYGALLKSAAVFFGECYPTLRECVKGERTNARRVGYCAPYFGRASRMSAAKRARLEASLDSYYHFMAFFSNWFVQVVRTLPPTTREAREVESEAAAAGRVYERIVGLRALERDESDGGNDAASTSGAKEGDDGATSAGGFTGGSTSKSTGSSANGPDSDAHARAAELQALLKQFEAQRRGMSASRYIELLRDARAAANERAVREEADAEALCDRIALWRGADSHLVDAARVRAEEERLAAMRRALEFDKRLLSIMSADVEQAIRENAAGATLAPPDAREDALPQNSLADAELLNCLYELLREYGLPAQKRDAAHMDDLRVKLQSGLQALVKSTVPDRRDIGRVIAEIGDGACDRRDPDAALSSFIAALTRAVMEEGSV